MLAPLSSLQAAFLSLFLASPVGAFPLPSQTVGLPIDGMRGMTCTMIVPRHAPAVDLCWRTQEIIAADGRLVWVPIAGSETAQPR